MDSRKSRLLGPTDLMLLGVAAIWGSSYAVAKQATLQVPVLEFLALRFALTFVVLLPALRPLFGAGGRRGLAVGGLLGANLLAVFVCETFGVSLTSASNAAFLISLCVALTPFAQWWLLGERPAPRMFAAAAVSTLGAALLSLGSPSDLSMGWGDALMLAAALLRAFMVCLTRKLAGHHTLPALTLTAVQCGVMAMGAAALSMMTSRGGWQPLPADAGFWWGMAWLVLLCTVFAFFVQNHAAMRSSPSRVALLMGSEPVFGALVAMLWLGEQIRPAGWLGGALMVLAAWSVTAPPRAPRLTAPSPP